MSNLILPFLLIVLYPLSLAAQQQDTLFTTYPDTQQRWEKIYADGDKLAENIYHANDEPWMTVQYAPQSVQHWKWYYDNGKPYFEATIVNDLLQGTYKIWYENGQLAEALVFEDNLENGEAIFYYENGQVAMQGGYAAGQMVGDWVCFDEKGQQADGMWTWPFAASRNDTRVSGQVENGQAVGIWTYQTLADQGRQNQKQYRRVFE